MNQASHLTSPGASLKRGLRRHWWSKKLEQRLLDAVGYILLTMISVIVLIPLAWTVSSSFKPIGEFYRFPPEWIPEQIRWQNYIEAWRMQPFTRFFLNTMLLVVLNTLGGVLSVPPVAYSFARLRFKGRQFMFIVLISVLMVPWNVRLIPTYILFHKLGWVGTYLPLFVPSFFGGAFMIFLTRQYLMTIPKELDEAARVDGASHLQVLVQVLLPLLKPPLIILAVFTFLDTWNEYLGPLIYLSKRETYTLALGLAFFRTRVGNQLHYLMAMSVVMLIPPMLTYFFAQRHIIGGIASVGLKG